MDVMIAFTPHAYWPGQPHFMGRRVQFLTVMGQEPAEVIRALLRDLGKKPDAVGIGKSKTGGIAIVTVDGTPIPLAYIEAGVTLDEANAALAALRQEGF